MRSADSNNIMEFKRATLQDPFGAPVIHTGLQGDWFARLTGDNLGLILMSGTTASYMHTRADAEDSFTGTEPTLFSSAPAVGTNVLSVVPTSGTLFAATAYTPDPSLPIHLITGALAPRPDGGPLEIQSSVRHRCIDDLFRGSFDVVMWLSDDGLTAILRPHVLAPMNMRGEVNLWMVQRSSTNAAFTRARELFEISNIPAMESSFAMPSLQAMEPTCGGDAWIVRTNHGINGDDVYGTLLGSFEWWRVPVGIGKPPP